MLQEGTACVKEVDGQLVTAQERSFVETVLLSDEAAQSPVADAGLVLEPQKTVKINQLSFNENGETHAAQDAALPLNLCASHLLPNPKGRFEYAERGAELLLLGCKSAVP